MLIFVFVLAPTYSVFVSCTRYYHPLDIQRRDEYKRFVNKMIVIIVF